MWESFKVASKIFVLSVSSGWIYFRGSFEMWQTMSACSNVYSRQEDVFMFADVPPTSPSSYHCGETFTRCSASLESTPSLVDTLGEKNLDTQMSEWRLKHAEFWWIFTLTTFSHQDYCNLLYAAFSCVFEMNAVGRQIQMCAAEEGVIFHT